MQHMIQTPGGYWNARPLSTATPYIHAPDTASIAAQPQPPVIPAGMTSASCYRTPTATPIAGTTTLPMMAPMSIQAHSSHSDAILLPSTPALMPGVVNSTFTPTAGVVTGAPKEDENKDEDEDVDSDEEPPRCIPVSTKTTKKRHSALPFVSHATSISGALKYSYPVTHNSDTSSRISAVEECCGHCFTNCKCRPRAYVACDCKERMERRSHRDEESRSRRSHHDERDRALERSSDSGSRRGSSELSRSIYDPYASTMLPAPPPILQQAPKPKSFFDRFRKPPPPEPTLDDWVHNALMHAPTNPTNALYHCPNGVALHPIITYTTLSCFDVLEPHSFLPPDLVACFTHPATSPPLLKMELFTRLHSPPLIVLHNSSGVTVGQVVEGILSAMQTYVSGKDVGKWSRARYHILTRWYWDNRKRMPNLASKEGFLVGDTLAGYTVFRGLLPVVAARQMDHSVGHLPSSAFLVFLDKSCVIPGLKDIFEFPR